MTWCDMMWQKVQAWRWWPWSGRRPWIHRFQFIGFLNAFNHSSKPWEKLGKHITWIKYCSNYSMCLLPGEGLLYCFFPSFFHLTVLIVSLVCEFHNHRLDQWQQKLLSTRTAGSWPVMACHGLPRFSLVWCWMCWCWSRQLMFKQLHWYSHVEPRLSMEAVISRVLAGDCHGQLWLLDRRPAWRVCGAFDLQVLPCVQHFSNLFCICPKCPHCHRLQLRHLLWSEVWA